MKLYSYVVRVDGGVAPNPEKKKYALLLVVSRQLERTHKLVIGSLEQVLLRT